MASEGLSSPADNFSAFDTFQRFESIYPDSWRGQPDYPLEQSISEIKNEEIRYIASRFALLENIPYVWGGYHAKVESPGECQECRNCITAGKLSTREVFDSCKACRLCGIDCTHLVNQILAGAHLPVPYGSTEELLARSAFDLARLYHVDDMGTDYSASKTGDVIVFPTHAVLMLQNHNNGYATVIHSAAYKKGTVFGGITIEDINLGKFAGGVRRILRHHVLIELNAERRRIQPADARVDAAIWLKQSTGLSGESIANAFQRMP